MGIQKQKTSSGFRSMYSDPRPRQTRKQSPPSENSRKAKSRKDGAGKKFIGLTQKHSSLRVQLSPEARVMNSCTRRGAALLGARTKLQLPGRIQFKQIGVLVERQSARKAMLDHDQRRTPRLRAVWVCLRLWQLSPEYICDTRSKKGWHRVIKFRRNLQPLAIVCVQSLLGSDRRRESLNLMRLLSIGKNDNDSFARSRWNLMFERKLRLR